MMKKIFVLSAIIVFVFGVYKISHLYINETAETGILQQNFNEYYPVEKVVDGDTIEVLINGQTETVRLIGINTPETVDPRKPVQCFGIEASNKAKETLTDLHVRLELDPDVGDRDKYNRLLRYIFLPDGTNFNLYMIQQGYAFEYTYQGNFYKYQDEFLHAEEDARNNNRGLWSPSACNGELKAAN